MLETGPPFTASLYWGLVYRLKPLDIEKSLHLEPFYIGDVPTVYGLLILGAKQS